MTEAEGWAWYEGLKHLFGINVISDEDLKDWVPEPTIRKMREATSKHIQLKLFDL